MDLTRLFCDVDDFMQIYEAERPVRLAHIGKRRYYRPSQLTESEVMTIMIAFHQSHYRHFKGFYRDYVCQHLKCAFPDLVSYHRFVERMQSVLEPLCAYLQACFGSATGISYMDSTPLAVCKYKRIARHRVFKGIAQTGKSSMGWFHGFKLHLVANHRGELLSVDLTPGNVDDRHPVMGLCTSVWGKLFADKGYISQALTDALAKRGVQLITAIRSNMKNKLMNMVDKTLLKKRSIIETINGQLKYNCQVEHSRHRSVPNFMVNLMAGLIAYALQPKKPSITGVQPLTTQGIAM